MRKACVYVDLVQPAEVDDEGATLEYCSAGELFSIRFPMRVWRALLEREGDRLNEIDRRKIVARVYEMRRPDH